MKSKSIDALMAINAQVKSLQSQLNISATEAHALQDAMGRLGVDKSGYVETYTQAAVAMRANTEELDRLGVKYKDNNGQLLTQAQFLTNVKMKLDEYRDGFDRSAAAAAIGAGSYAKVVDALKVTDAQIQQSKNRLDDYNLGIGPQTQAAVARYQQSMRDFESETRKTTEGFSRVMSDSFMPMATWLAEWLKNGWPYAVGVFRVAVATFSTAIYGLATTFGLAYEAIVGSALAIVAVVVGAIESSGKALTGDFSGAKIAMADALDAAKERMAKTGQAMVDIAVANNKNIKAAWAADDRNQPLDQARAAAAQQGAGKDWKPAAKPDAGPNTDSNRAPFTRYMEELDRMNVKAEQNEYAMMRVKAAQEAVRQGGLNLADAMEQANKKIDEFQRKQSALTVNAFAAKLELENKAYAQQSELIGLSTTQQELAAVAIKRHMDAENAINEAKKAGKPLDEQGIKDLRTNTEEQIKNMQALVAARQAMQRTGEFGQNKAFQEYADAASNQALQVKSAWGNAFRGMEDAMVAFVKTGKMDFKSMADSIISDLIRIMVQRSITGPLAGAMGNMFGSGTSTDYSLSSGQSTGGLGLKGGSADSLYSSTPSFAVGTPYVPRDMLALVHEGEAITPKGANTGINVQIINNTQSQVTAQSDGQGGLTVLVDMVKNAMASDVFNGVGSMPRAMEARYGLRTAGA